MDTFDLESRAAHHRDQFAQRERPRMRGVAQQLDLITTLRPRGIFVRVQILDRNRPSRPADPEHLREDRLRIQKMMEREAAHDDVELRLAISELIRLANLEADVRQSSLETRTPRNFDWR